MSNGFEGLDIENMFAEAVSAAENTGEKDPANLGKSPPVKKEEAIKKEKTIEKNKSETTKTPNEKEITLKVTSEEIKEPEKLIRAPILKVDSKPSKQNIIEKNDTPYNPGEINPTSIAKIIEMKEMLDNYTDKEKSFIQGYFQQELGNAPEIIYSALTANRRSINAINKIVIAKEHNSAERAFYLMELSNNDVEAIHEQISLLTGELESTQVSDNNKIKVCRDLEGIISRMDSNVFLFVNKLQEFANKSIM